MNITGANFIGNKLSNKGSDTFNAINPQTGKRLKPFFYEATREEIDETLIIAKDSFLEYSKKSFHDRALLLEAIADEILLIGEKLLQRCHLETSLPIQKLETERMRTVSQLRMFAQLLREGSWIKASIDTAVADRNPTPKSDIRLTNIPLGPVAVFGASNFPLAFSVAGGDTASALAAGCSVIVKANPSHPGTSEMIAHAITKAIERTNMPTGIFSLLQGISHNLGLSLVKHPEIKAVSFTGSFRGGKDLFEAATQRIDPIPCYAEMGSTNPLFLFPEQLKKHTKEIANDLYNSINLSSGQFCTKPGLIFVSESEVLDDFIGILKVKTEKTPSGTLLGDSIKKSYEKNSSDLMLIKGIECIATGKRNEGDCEASSKMFITNKQTFLNNPRLEDEIFGPSVIIVKVKSPEDFYEIADSLKGQLTASIHADKNELTQHSSLINLLSKKVGRIIINEYSTGVEVCQSMHHGGPYPSTTDIKSTSVGTNAIYRFVRPVCYQNFPGELLPDELKDHNPLNIFRQINGKYTRDKIEH